MACLGLNGFAITGAFLRDSNAGVPKSAFSYEDCVAMQNQLQVPQTAPPIPSIGNAVAVDRIVNGTRWITMKSPHGEWTDEETFAPPEEYLAKKDIERQKAIERKMVQDMSDEQKEMLRKLESGEIFEKSKLIEESRKPQ